MSYIYYIASARPLPVGKWRTTPYRVYSSYDQYSKSPDFVQKWRPGGRFSTPEKQTEYNRRFKGKVAVYSARPDYVSIQPFEEWEFTPGRFVTLKNLRRHLTLPEVYFVDAGERTLREYLRWTMQPGEQVEFLCCWNGEEQKRITEPVEVIDLRLSDEALCTGRVYEGNFKQLFLAPDEPQPFSLPPVRESYMVSIWPDFGWEAWNMAEKMKQLREMEIDEVN